jgi:hypothetical protein
MWPYYSVATLWVGLLAVAAVFYLVAIFVRPWRRFCLMIGTLSVMASVLAMFVLFALLGWPHSHNR